MFSLILVCKDKDKDKEITNSGELSAPKKNMSEIAKKKKKKKLSFEKFIKKSVKEKKYLEIFSLKTGKKIIGFVDKMIGDLLVIRTNTKIYKIKESDIELRESFKEIVSY
jgi:hypothetical protein